MNAHLRLWRRRSKTAAAIVVAVATGTGVLGQQKEPHVGYAFPAGGCQGTTFTVTIGGQYLSGVTNVHMTGKGFQASVIKHLKPLTPKQLNELRQKVKEYQAALRGDPPPAGKTDRAKPEKGRTVAAKRTAAGAVPGAAELGALKAYVKLLGYGDLDWKDLMELRKRLSDPKRQQNPQLGEVVTVRISLAPDASPGARELRLVTPVGLSNPIAFEVGEWAECVEKEPNDWVSDGCISNEFPVVVNGQIMPGDVDRFRFFARKGMRLVAIGHARRLIPYLADAVPGWFQATLALYDAQGNELAFVDDYRFSPDPVMCCRIPEDGKYVLEIRDAIYRGREDFVYRIELGELPFITDVFPLGGRAGEKTTVAIEGWNLPAKTVVMHPSAGGAATVPIEVRKGKRASNTVPFAVDTLPECTEAAGDNDSAGASQRITLPTVVNGRIESPGDWDVYRFSGSAGARIVAEVYARRLGSPLDSVLKLVDAGGNTVALNDDHENKGEGLETHHADSYIETTLPATGTYYVHVGDAQNKGSASHAYRVRLAAPLPDFALRVVPSCINARMGTTVPVTVYALRRGGLDGPIDLSLAGVPAGFTLDGGQIPAGVDTVRVTVSVPPRRLSEPVALKLEGCARIGERTVRHAAVPAEDMMQAFLYRHLVPTQEWLADVSGKWGPKTPLTFAGTGPLQLRAGATVSFRVSAPKRPFMRLADVELIDPPEGITVQSVKPSGDGMSITLAVDNEKVKAGLKGNLILNAFMEQPVRDKEGKTSGGKKRAPMGVLPAIPFEMVRL